MSVTEVNCRLSQDLEVEFVEKSRHTARKPETREVGIPELNVGRPEKILPIIAGQLRREKGDGVLGSI